MDTKDTKFETIIFEQTDPQKPERSVWVRITSRKEWVSIAIFKEKPTPETLIGEAMASFDYAPCRNGESKLLCWDEDTDPADEDGEEFTLVSSIDDWEPREDDDDDEDEDEDDEEREPDKVIREREAREKILVDGDPRFQADAPVIGFVSLPCETFLRMVGFVADFADAGGSRPIMDTIHMELQDGELYMVTADAFRLAVAKEEVKSCSPISWSRSAQPNMPVDLVANFAAALTNEHQDEVCISFTEEFATLASGPLNVRFLLEDGEYPGWRKILAKTENPKTRVRGQSQAFLDALDLIKAEAEKADQVTRWSIHDDVRIVVKEKYVPRDLVTTFVEGTSKEGVDLTLALNHQYAVASMSRFPDAGVVMHLTTNDTPVRCTYEGHDGYWTMIMPMRVNR